MNIVSSVGDLCGTRKSFTSEGITNVCGINISNLAVLVAKLVL